MLPFVDRLWLFETEVCLQVADAHPTLDAKTDDVLSGRNRINDRKLLRVHGNRLHVVSDVHGYYTQMKSALEKAGFFSDDAPHKLIMLGDIFDRGHEAK